MYKERYIFKGFVKISIEFFNVNRAFWRNVRKYIISFYFSCLYMKKNFQKRSCNKQMEFEYADQTVSQKLPCLKWPQFRIFEIPDGFRIELFLCLICTQFTTKICGTINAAKQKIFTLLGMFLAHDNLWLFRRDDEEKSRDLDHLAAFRNVKLMEMLSRSFRCIEGI